MSLYRTTTVGRPVRNRRGRPPTSGLKRKAKKRSKRVAYRGRIGSQFQAAIPDFQPSAPSKRHAEQCLWIPNGNGEVAERLSFRLGVNCSRDERLLFSLLVEKYNVTRAHALFLASKEPNAPRRTFPPQRKSFSEHEVLAFLRGVRLLGKKFSKIKGAFLPHRTVGELVHLYYVYKQMDKRNKLLNKKRQLV
uniref:ELM2 domain-containing protein n=1 Tax=Steinernema glaseri TaxID=37863 RepID=A0A1I7XY18_9BILA